MAGCARKEIVRPDSSQIFHVWQRCVRRAYLLGKDPLTGVDHSHRREWLVERLKLLVTCFVIDVGFTSILSNHFHLVLRTSPRLIKRMGAYEIARRWLRVYPGKRVLDGNWIEPTEEQIKALAEDKRKIDIIRRRLCDVSWFMAATSEYIARRANAEDGCSGRFFEGRFRCKALENEGALLAAGLYVDLNQIRAGEARTPEQSLCCSVSFRIQTRRAGLGKGKGNTSDDQWLAPLTLTPDQLGDVPSANGRRASDKGLLPISLEKYLELLDWAGRQRRRGKRGAIPAHLTPILERLGLVPEELMNTVDRFPQWFRRFAGTAEQFEAKAKALGRRALHGIQQARKAFRTSD